MIRLRQTHGFTLVELLVVIALIGLVLSLAYSLQFFGLRSSTRTDEKAMLQRTARLATDFIVQEVLRTNWIDLDPGEYANSLTYWYVPPPSDVGGSPAGNRWFELDEGRIIHNASSFETDAVIKTLRFRRSGSTFRVLNIYVEAEGKTESYELERAILLRNLPASDGISDFASFVINENIFVYGSTLYLRGSASAFSDDGVGTLVIDNNDSSDLVFAGNSVISLQNMLIDKEGNAVVFDSSTKLGQYGVTELVSIRGDVELNNGGAEINGAELFIEGNVSFNNSARVTGDVIRINGDVTFRNASAELNGGEIYIDGNVIVPLNGGNLLSSGSIYISGSVTFEARNSRIDGHTVQIMGGVQLHNGTSIDAASLYIGDGVIMRPQSQISVAQELFVVGEVNTEWEAAIVNNSTSYFDGNVTIAGNNARLEGGTVHIDGAVSVASNADILGELSYTGTLSGNPSAAIVPSVPLPVFPVLPAFPTIPSQPVFGMPLLRTEEWYDAREYELVTTGGLESGKVFSQGDYFHTGSDSFNDVIVVSTGDITIDGTSGITGVLVAPNGRVRFRGDSSNPFRGVVIARDGFEVTGLGTNVFFENITKYISDPEDFPFD